MQELQQEQKFLSFEEICPEFSQILSEHGGYMACKNAVFKSEDGKTRAIMDPMCCIVGEAHTQIVDEAHGL